MALTFPSSDRACPGNIPLDPPSNGDRGGGYAMHVVRDIGVADVAAYGIPFTRVVPTTMRGDANEPLPKVITCAAALPVSHSLGAEIPVPGIGRHSRPRGRHLSTGFPGAERLRVRGAERST